MPMPADAGGGFRRMYTHSPVVSQSLREMNVRNSPVNQKPRYLAQASHTPDELVVRRHTELDHTLLSHPRLALSRSVAHGKLTPTERTLRYFDTKDRGSERSRAEAQFMSSAREGIEIPSRENFKELRSLYPHRRREAPRDPSPWIHPVMGDPARPHWQQRVDNAPSLNIRDCKAVYPFKIPSPRLPDCAAPGGKFVYDYSKGATRDGGDTNVLGHVSVDYFKQRIKRDAEKKLVAKERQATAAENQREVDSWEQRNAEGMANMEKAWTQKPFA